MIYTTMTEAAMKLSYEAHHGQVDKAGLPYVFHPFHLAEQMDSEEEVCVALLHDVIEDTDFTVADIRAAGMSDSILVALELMTHDPAINYFDYVANLAKNPIARKVKIADLRHNSDLSRLHEIGPSDLARRNKYAKALALLCAEQY